MAKSDSSVFKRGYNKVNRRVVIPAVKAAGSFALPAGAFVSRVYAQNRSTTASSLSVGNAAAGAQYLAAVAIPVADVNGAGILYPRAAIALQPSKVNSEVHYTLTAYPIANPTAPVAKQKGAVDVVIEFEELWGSLDLPSFVNQAGY